MPRGPRLPLKQGRNGTRSINAQLATLSTAVTAATASKRGTVLRGVAVANAVDETDIVAQFNALLASLRTAGVIAT